MPLKVYSIEISKVSDKYEAWQIEQAYDAIRHFNYFLRVSTSKRDVLSKTQIEDLIELVKRSVRVKHLSYNTEKTYVWWIRRFLKWVESNKKDTEPVDHFDISNFFTYLAVQRKVSPSTQNQALNAIVYLFKNILLEDLDDKLDGVRASYKRRLPVVLSKEEIYVVIKKMKKYQLIAMILYGCGLRLSECLNLRIKDIDFARNLLTVRDGKGGKDRITLLPSSLAGILKKHLDEVKDLYDYDRKNNVPGVFVPQALDVKYKNIGKEWIWFWIFPSPNLSVDPSTHIVRRHHIYPSTIQREFKRALKSSGIDKRATLHSLRHSFATHLLESGYDVRTVQYLLGHKKLETTMIYTHLAKKNLMGVKSPIDSGFDTKNIITY